MSVRETSDVVEVAASVTSSKVRETSLVTEVAANVTSSKVRFTSVVLEVVCPRKRKLVTWVST